ncbi:MAG: helicase [Candidatus Hydrogenedentota bacterium]|nr:MAG: helicase [Candidatus Hydrogenedentota bacterium]GIX44519.1 MAG: DEAD/DEAH box helicase [Candidatus Sumerlaea sp.]
MFRPENPIIVQSDMTVLLETMGPLYEQARDFLGQFAELRKSPEYLHTYAITPLSLWNAASAGLKPDAIIQELKRLSKYDVPQNVLTEIREQMARYGKIRLVKDDATGDLLLVCDDKFAIEEILASPHVRPFISQRVSENTLLLEPGVRGRAKQALIKIGYPVEDLAGYTEGDPLPFSLRSKTRLGANFALREYQRDAVETFWAGGSPAGGSGVLVLPCGAGKTVIGMACMEKIQQHTLILTTNITALRQWIRELLDKTTLTEDQIGEYSGEVKEVRPVTVTTYQIMTYKKAKGDNFPHMELFQKYNWGLIIYDEVHLLPAPVFRATAEIQARRRLGLTATLVREDGKEDDVFSLIGPKRFDKPWKELEQQGWIAKALCMEIRVPLAEDKRLEYATAELRSKYRIAMENPVKLEVVKRLLEKHAGDNVLIIGQYLDQLEQVRAMTGAPIITGETPNAEREALYADFKSGRQKVLVVSKVANFAVDLPDANVAIQISGTFRSRQEESQRVGRVLRPKPGDNYAYFYSIVTKDTKDQDCAKRRSLFLTEQGYRYKIKVLDEASLNTETFDFNEAEDLIGTAESIEVENEEEFDDALAET